MASDLSAGGLIDELGIDHSKDIDMDAIALTAGILVTYRRLTGCDTFLVEHEDRAMVTVNRDCSTERQRFSLAQDLGHWH